MVWRTCRFPAYSRGFFTPLHSGPALCRTINLGAFDPNIARVLLSPPRSPPEVITAVGWVRTVRKQKRITFLELGDGSTSYTLQAVLSPSQSEGLSTGTAVAISGTWQSAPDGTEQANELHVKNIKIYGPANESFPIQKKYHSSEYLRTIPHLRLRTPLNAVLARLRSEVDHAFSVFFKTRDFIRLQPPIITSSDCEGAGEVFTVKSDATSDTEYVKRAIDDNPVEFFKSPKYLTVSSQLHLEAFVHEHPKVWTLSPTFRAEKSDTPRHVSEFSMLEVEVRTENLEDITGLVEIMIREVVQALQRSAILDELLFARRKATSHEVADQQIDIQARWENLTSEHWPRVTYEQALIKLKQAHTEHAATFVREPSLEGLQLEHEKWIVRNIGLGRPVFVTHYPQDIKPFYMLPSPNVRLPPDTETVSCFDLLLPEVCEVVGGSLREHRLEKLTERMQASGMDLGSPSYKGPLDWYLDLRRYGSVPHGGFGMGLDRLLSYLSGVPSIKDTVQWPRYHGRCDA